MKLSGHALASLLLSLCVGTSGAARPSLEEVIVTARFKDAELLESAGSISVVDAEAITGRAASHLEDTINVLPNVSLSSGGSRARFVQIRGVGDLEQFVDPKHFPSVGVVIDDVELNSVATGAVLLDVDQIELLRGPQGTRFGSSALAGLVKLRSHEPTDRFAASLEAGYGNYDRWHVEGMINGPLSENAQGRLALRQYGSDGFIDNTFLGSDDTNDRDELAVRGRWRWSVDPLLIDVTGLYLDIDNGYDAFSLDNRRTTFSDQPGDDAQQSYHLSGRLEWDLGEDLALESVIAFSDSDELYGFDEDWVFTGFCDGVRCDPLFEFSSTDTLARDKQQWTADLRLSGAAGALSWVAGAYVQHRDEDLRRERFGIFQSNYQTERYALYAQAEYALNERWQVTAGARFERFEDDYGDSNRLLSASTDDFWSGDLTLEYSPTEDTLIYATVAQGAKPGGLNTEASSVLPFMAPQFQNFLNDGRLMFDRETLINKELGIKGRYFDGRLALRAALFHMDRNDAQLESWMWDASSFLWVGILDNVGEAENYGAELEIDWAVNERVDVFAGVGYLETHIDAITTFDLDLAQFVVRRDREQTKAPRWHYHVGMAVDFGGGFSGRVSVEGRDERYFGFYHDETLDAYHVLNASLSYEIGKTRVQLWARNLLDEDYQVHGLFFANDPRDGFLDNRAYYQFGEPRVFGVTMSYAF